MVLLLAAITSCSSSDDDEGGRDEREAASPDQSDAAIDQGAVDEDAQPTDAIGPVMSMLALVPDTTVSHQSVQIIDLVLVGDRLGLAAPDPADNAASEQYLIELFQPIREEGEPPVYLPPIFAEEVLHLPSWRSELGFALPDADVAAVFGTPPSRVLLASTTLDPSAMVDAVLADPTWGPEAMVTEVSGATVLTWPGDPLRHDPERRSGVRPLGRPGQLSIADDGTVVRALDPDQFDQVAELLAGDGASMADNRWFGGVGRALDEAGVHHAFLTTAPATVDTLAATLGPDAAEEARSYGPLLPPYQALGVGSTLDDDGNALLVVSFGTPGEAEAAAMVEAFTTVVADGESLVRRQPWSDVFTVVDSTTDGNVATITLATDQPLQGYQAVISQDTLFMIS